jgi:hypothetical protein
MSNIEVFTDFKNFVETKNAVEGQTIKFNAQINYKWDNGKQEAEEFLDVYLYLDSMDYGSIQISDGSNITAEKVYTRIESKYKSPVLSLTKNNSLVITGNGSKIGNYKITIIPN